METKKKNNTKQNKQRDQIRIRMAEERRTHVYMAIRLQRRWRRYTFQKNEHILNCCSALKDIAISAVVREKELQAQKEAFVAELMAGAPVCTVCMQTDERKVFYFSKCCNMPICLQCLMQVLKMEDPPEMRFASETRAYCVCRKKWSLSYMIPPFDDIRDHLERFCTRNITTAELIQVFDKRPFQCFKCRELFADEAGLLGHIADNCPDVSVPCQHCPAFGKRGYILGEHYVSMHAAILCHICLEKVRIEDLDKHMHNHLVSSVDELIDQTSKTLSSVIREISCSKTKNVLDELRRLHRECGGTKH